MASDRNPIAEVWQALRADKARWAMILLPVAVAVIAVNGLALWYILYGRTAEKAGPPVAAVTEADATAPKPADNAAKTAPEKAKAPRASSADEIKTAVPAATARPSAGETKAAVPAATAAPAVQSEGAAEDRPFGTASPTTTAAAPKFDIAPRPDFAQDKFDVKRVEPTRHGSTLEFSVGSANTILSAPAVLGPRSVTLTREASGIVLQGMLPSGTAVPLATCTLVERGNRRVLQCTLAEGADQKLKDQTEWLVIEVADLEAKTVHQCTLARPPVVTHTFHAGLDVTLSRVQELALQSGSFKHPWVDALRLADGAVIAPLTKTPSSPWRTELTWPTNRDDKKGRPVRFTLLFKPKPDGSIEVAAQADTVSALKIAAGAGARKIHDLNTTLTSLKSQETLLNAAILRDSTSLSRIQPDPTVVEQARRDLEVLRKRIADTEKEIDDAPRVTEELATALATAMTEHATLRILDPWDIPVAIFTIDYAATTPNDLLETLAPRPH